MAVHRYCDGVRRRDFLQAGALGIGGVTLPSYLRMAEAGEVAGDRQRSGIFVYLTGGQTHMDTFDLKPEAPVEYRGEFNPIKTNVAGVEISEHLPKLAQQADKFAVLRGVHHTLAAHNLGKMYMNTGNRPVPSLVYPGYASVVAKELNAAPDLPKTVAVPNPSHPAGYLGVAYSPLATGASPGAGRPFSVRGMALTNGLTVTDVSRRQNLLADLDGRFRGAEEENDLIGGLDRFSEQAYNIMSSKRAREAFDVSQEPVEIQAQFGEDSFALSCLLAVRLVEAGVRFVNLNLGGWDTHADNFNRLKTALLPKLDTGMAGLFSELDRRGLLETTSVMMTGEFGRTPKVNTRGGRDHYPRAMAVLMGGGGMRGGQVIGASDDKGTGPANEPITPEMVAASFYHSLGINAEKEYNTNTGRPVMVVRQGEIIPELFA